MWNTIILLGAPGSGKGTTASDVLAEAPDLIHLSTGDMLRDAIKAGSVVGLEAKSYMERGALVPDEVVVKIVAERLQTGDTAARYLFDGFPRTLEQARALDAFLAASGGGRVTHVFLLDVPQAELVERIAGRLICRACGAVYHRTNIPPKQEGVCDQCGGELHQRADDRRETVLNRLAVYESQTASLIGFYEEQGVLHRIEGRSREAAAQFILDRVEPADDAS